MNRSKREPSDTGQFAFEGLDRALHEKARLGILSSLIANPQGLLFAELKTLCSLTDGNLNRHVQVLQKAGLVEIWKGSQGKRTQTLVRMTDKGRRRFMEYISVLEQIVAEAIEASGAKEGTRARGLDSARRRWGWSPA
jgi:DNA-binding MarR family transcriptional regulator